MVRPEVLKTFVCPEDRTALEVASTELVAKINQAIAAGSLANRAGAQLERPLEGGLVREDGSVLYPIIDEIPMLLVDEGIPLDQPAIRP